MTQKIYLIKYLCLLLSLTQLSIFCCGQFITSGKIHYERKTNLQKINSEHMPKWMKDYIDKEKYKIDNFVLSFNDKESLFAPSDPISSDFKEMLTIKNTVYCNHQTDDRLTVMNVMGQILYVRDTIDNIPWKITDNTRNIAGYNCQMAYFEKDTNFVIYAWYAQELIPSIGPETIKGLPGTILGLATENGEIVYFAKSIEIQEIDEQTLRINTKKNKIYSKNELKAEITKKLGNTPSIQSITQAYFMWY